MEKRVSGEIFVSFQQARLSIDQINNKQSNAKTIHPKHVVDCQDDDIKEIFYKMTTKMMILMRVS